MPKKKRIIVAYWAYPKPGESFESANKFLSETLNRDSDFSEEPLRCSDGVSRRMWNCGSEVSDVVEHGVQLKRHKIVIYEQDDAGVIRKRRSPRKRTVYPRETRAKSPREATVRKAS